MGLRTVMQTATLGSTLFVANQHQALAQNTKPQTRESSALLALEQNSLNIVGITSAGAGGLLAAYLGYRKGRKDGIALAREEYDKKLTRLENTVDDHHKQAISMVDELEEHKRKPPEPSNN